jgi:hypothetical protein
VRILARAATKNICRLPGIGVHGLDSYPMSREGDKVARFANDTSITIS